MVLENGNVKMSKEEAKKIQEILISIIIVVVAAAFLRIPQWLTNWIVQWLISALVGTVFSMTAAAIVEAFTGDLLKSITLTVEIGDFKFSVTAFAIVTIIVKLWLFHQF
jgi:large-conductance mechanosensitive channel